MALTVTVELPPLHRIGDGGTLATTALGLPRMMAPVSLTQLFVSLTKIVCVEPGATA